MKFCEPARRPTAGLPPPRAARNQAMPLWRAEMAAGAAVVRLTLRRTRAFPSQRALCTPTGFGVALQKGQDPIVLGGSAASPAAAETFEAWHKALKCSLHGGDYASGMRLLKPRMHTACVFRPPTYFKPWVGRDETLCLLGAVSEVFGTSFRYGRQWLSDDGREWALEFSAHVGSSAKTIHGIDLVSLDKDGLITEFTVLARPPNAVEALRNEMMQKVPVRMAALKVKQALGLTT